MVTKAMKDIWDRYRKSRIYYLCGDNEECAYKSCSEEKWKAWNECRNLVIKLNGWGVHYIGVSNWFFTMGFRYEREDGVEMFMYITPSKRIECPVSELERREG